MTPFLLRYGRSRVALVQIGVCCIPISSAVSVCEPTQLGASPAVLLVDGQVVGGHLQASCQL